MKVILDKILVKEATESYQGALYLPPSSEAGAQVIAGIVIAVGSNVTQVNVKDKVYFNKYNALKVTIKGADYFTLTEKEVLVVVSE